MARRATARVTARPALAGLAALLVAVLSVAGCVSMPTGGPVQSYPVTQQGADTQAQPFVQVQPQAPRPGWNPSQIVQGFLTASASFGLYGQVARQYLTPEEQQDWQTNWSAVVYKAGPNVMPAAYPAGQKNPTKASVVVKGTIQASLKGSGSYSVPSASAQDAASYAPEPFQLEKRNGQWRISHAPLELLLTSNAFENDYQLRNLYFYDPAVKYLVPDPVYVPLGSPPGDGLVRDLITPPGDWLKSSTRTAFPAGTKVTSVQIDGVTAVVNLTGTIAKASEPVMEQISAQLWWTLHGAVQGGPNGQAVGSVEILVNGKPWSPRGDQGNPVQSKSTVKYAPALGASGKFYYVDRQGYLYSRAAGVGSSTKLAKIGTGYSQIAVSPDGQYLAALRGDTLYAGLVTDKLAKRGTGYLAMSWDANDNLWASVGDRIVMFRGSPRTSQPLGEKVPVTVFSDSYIDTPPYTLLKVAPDGVRVAIVQNGGMLTFGAISGLQGPNPQISLSTVQDTPPTDVPSAPGGVNFTALAWYGPDDVITLATPGPAVTDYPVSGGSPRPIPTDSEMRSISASYQQPLVAGLPKGQIVIDPGLTGSWTPVSGGTVSANGTPPVYPG